MDSDLSGSQVPEGFPSAMRLQYLWREEGAHCIKDVVDIIGPSNKRTHGVLLSAWICQRDLDETTEAQRERMLNSFSFQ